MSACQYKNIFGAPGTGVHATRIGGFAAVDVALTLILIVIIAAITGASLIATTVVVGLLAVLLHYLFCVQTHLTHDILKIN